LLSPLDPTPRKIYSVSQLTEKIKRLLEDAYAMVWISGEISNLRIPASGHAYFTLKDNDAQISAVMFRGQLRQIKFDLDDGMTLIALGRISVYAPRGNYQIILEYAEPQGIGALQIAFEQLKLKLESEGLFNQKYKTPLPFLPQRIGVITSPSGSVVKDILNVISRRYFNIIVNIYPVRVQGHASENEIVAAIALANRIKRDDVLILARGGGSFEDLAPFNGETVARAIFDSDIPVISAVGHETDYSIADFVADLRAPTPSAAAEITVPVKTELQSKIIELYHRNTNVILNYQMKLRKQLDHLKRLIIHPGKRVQDLQLHLDRITDRLAQALKIIIHESTKKHHNLMTELAQNSPLHRLEGYRAKIELIEYKILQLINKHSRNAVLKFNRAQALLKAVNPAAVLERGYSITRTLPDLRVVMNAEGLITGQKLEIQLAKGKIDAAVIKK